MKLNLSIVLFLLLFRGIYSQSFNPSFKALPEKLVFEDFSFLKEELKDVQVVMLGEETHYDGNVFEAKTEMIKYLFKEMGFTTIAFESSIYDVWDEFEKSKKGKDIKNSFQNSIFSIWSGVEEFQSFIHFFEKNRSSLKIFGFDSQIPNSNKEEKFVIDLFKYCRENNISIRLDQEDLILLIDSFWRSNVFDEKDIPYKKFQASFNFILKEIEKKGDDEQHFYWKQIIKSLLATGDDFHNRKNPLFSTFVTNVEDNKRDKQMADNLLAYIKKHPNEKIICWGANAHFVNDMTSIKADTLREFKPMGSYIKESLKSKAYSLGMIGAEDSIKLGYQWYKSSLDSLSFEYYLKQKKIPHMFISSKQEEMKQIKPIRFFSPITHVDAQLNLLHDGYLFFDEIRESTPIETIQEIEIDSIKKDADAALHSVEINENKLDEVIVEGRYSPYFIIKKAIRNLKRNYSNKPFKSSLYSKDQIKIDDSIQFEFELFSKQYHRGYHQPYRSTLIHNQLKINKGDPTKMKFNYYSFLLRFGQPHISYFNFLNKRKHKKFDFKITNRIDYRNQEAFVIQFSTDRDHFNFSGVFFPSFYSGELIILKKNFAIVKIIQKWKVKEWLSFESNFFNKVDFSKEWKEKEMTYMTSEYEFNEVSGGNYFLTHAFRHKKGFVKGKNKIVKHWEEKQFFYWNEFEFDSVVPITFKEEEKRFKMPKFNIDFWDSFQPHEFVFKK